MSQQKKIILSALTAVACLSPAQLNAMATGGGCVTGNIAVTVISSPLDFAEMAACTVGNGNLNLNAKTGALTTGGCVSSTSGISAVASVRVVGGQSSNGIKVYIRVPASATISSGGNSMSVPTMSLAQGAGTQTVTMGGAKTSTYNIGGVLNMSAGQAGGTYTGSANVTASCF